MNEIAIGVLVFTATVMSLVGLILLVRSRLVPSGAVQLVVNGAEPLRAQVGTQLIDALLQAGIHIPSGCGGKGTCGQCRVTVLEGGGAIRPTEQVCITKRDARAGTRLACQVPVKQDMRVRVPEEIFGVRQWDSVVRSNENVSPMIKELVLELPSGEDVDYRAGCYMLITAPAYAVGFSDLDIASEYHAEWDRHDFWRYRAVSRREESRAYSIASYPDETDILKFDVRIAVPPPGSTPDVPPGIVSSYIFSLKEGDTVRIAGPYGHFTATDTDKEMVFIGGGAGMGPMRAHILDQLKRLKSGRKISFWYGARSKQDLFYVNVFDALQSEHDTFNWTAALSDPQPGDAWNGRTGFIHEVLLDDYLAHHPAPEDCEYYVCGPPMMLRAVLKMLDDLGVEEDSIFYDDFGG